MCVNGTARYSTHTATALGIDRDIDYLPECRSSRGNVYKGCLLISYGRFFHDNAIVSLSIDNKDAACIVNDYYRLDLRGTPHNASTVCHMYAYWIIYGSRDMIYIARSLHSIH